MTDDPKTKALNWHLPEIADKAEHQKLTKSFHEEEKTLNKNRILNPPEDVGPVLQLNYTKERRNWSQPIDRNILFSND